MDIEPEVFNKVLAEFQSFGPRRRIPIRERWKELLPKLGVLELDALEKQCKIIEVFALELAEQVRNNSISESSAQKQIKNSFSMLDQERLEQTWNQAMYFTAR